jgi:hypothetical protein
MADKIRVTSLMTRQHTTDQVMIPSASANAPNFSDRPVRRQKTLDKSGAIGRASVPATDRTRL